jgi:hypothetical protein
MLVATRMAMEQAAKILENMMNKDIGDTLCEES